MNKPVAMIIDDFKKNIVTAINKSGLHPEMISMIMDEMNREVKILANNQAAKEKAEYEKDVAEAEKSEKKTENE